MPFGQIVGDGPPAPRVIDLVERVPVGEAGVIVLDRLGLQVGVAVELVEHGDQDRDGDRDGTVAACCIPVGLGRVLTYRLSAFAQTGH